MFIQGDERKLDDNYNGRMITFAICVERGSRSRRLDYKVAKLSHITRRTMGGLSNAALRTYEPRPGRSIAPCGELVDQFDA